MEKDIRSKKEYINTALSSIIKEANVKECLYLDKTDCSEKIIKAHSIQNNRILNRLSHNGEVLMATHDATETSFRIIMKPVGKNKATTFTGFCDYHDNKIFKPIEEFSYDPKNLEQNALFAFRALAKEWHAKLRAQNIYRDLLDKNIIFKFALEGTELALKDIEEHVEIFKKIILQHKFELLKTINISFDQEFLLAVSSGVNFPYDFEGVRLDHLKPESAINSKFLFITIFPENGKTNIILSYLARDEKFYSFLQSQLVEVGLDLQKTRINNLIMMNCENLVLSSSCWNKLEKQQQDLFLKGFDVNLNNIESPESLGTDIGFSIFS